MSSNFEGPARRQEGKISINQAYEVAKKVLTVGEIRPEDFNDLYDITKDQKQVAFLETKMRQQETPETAEVLRLATVFEAIFLTQTGKNNWFGKDATVTKTSRYDDVINGVDFIAEFEEESSAAHLGLVIDVTLAKDLSKKFDRIKEEIRKGQLAKVKYFQSSKMNFRGELSQVPRVVVAGDAKTIKNLAEFWMNSQISDNEKILRTHFFQFQVLIEIALQLEFFSKYAAQLGNESLVAVYKRALNLVRKILREKRDPSSGITDSGERDGALDEVEAILSRSVS